MKRLRILLLVLLGLALPLGAQAQTDCDTDHGLPAIGQLDAAAKYAEFPVTRFTARGTPFEIGKAFGTHYREAITQFARDFPRMAAYRRHEKPGEVVAAARKLAQHLSPADREEIRGLAEGAGVSEDAALILNLFYSLTVDDLACRQLAAWGAATRDGTLIHGRNLDWNDYPGDPLQRNHVILNVMPDDGVEYLILTWPGLAGALTGTNAEGITLAFNRLSSYMPLEPSEPVFFTLKRILRTATSLDEAVTMLKEAKPLGSGSILISDAEAKRAVVVEMINGEIGVREATGAGTMIGNANHPTAQAHLKTARRVGAAEEPTQRVAQQLKEPLDARAVQKVLTDKDVLLRINLMSVIFEPEKNRMYLATGTAPAALGPYRAFELFDED